MSASLEEVQIHVAALCELLGVRLESGQVILHFADGRLRKVEIPVTRAHSAANATSNHTLLTPATRSD